MNKFIEQNKKLLWFFHVIAQSFGNVYVLLGHRIQERKWRMLPARKAAIIVLVYTACACWLVAGEVVAGEEKLRSMKYTSRTKHRAIVWQNELRSKLVRLLKMDDLVSSKTLTPLHPKTLSSEKREKYVFQEMEINSTPGRRIKIVLTLPTNFQGPFPAVVCVAGHSGTRHTSYEKDRSYRRFAHVLAEKGYVTISATVNQHKVYEKGRTLMGERLWDLMRCVDFLTSLEKVDSQRIGCAGLSLGGEMVMWLGAMDERVQATVSAGFLTRMDQMEKNHCMCWKFPGSRELVDFADIYSLTAPRALLCQNGLKEPPSQFPVSIAREALKEIGPIYTDFKQRGNLALVAHKGGHAIDLPSLLTFFEKHLTRRKNVAQPSASAEKLRTAELLKKVRLLRRHAPRNDTKRLFQVIASDSKNRAAISIQNRKLEIVNLKFLPAYKAAYHELSAKNKIREICLLRLPDSLHVVACPSKSQAGGRDPAIYVLIKHFFS